MTRLGENKHMLDELFRILAQDFASNKADIAQAYQTHNLPLLKAVTHKMKGSLGYCGLPRLEAAVRAIEIAAKENNAEEVERWYQETLNAINEAELAYQEWAKAN